MGRTLASKDRPSSCGNLPIMRCSAASSMASSWLGLGLG